jgi:hypothetical protein
VGAIYNGQYAKGLAHLIIFSLLCVGASRAGDPWDALFGFGIAFFVVYQIIDAVRSARAIQAGLPAPDPFGLGTTFGAGEKLDTSKIPMGAVVLILIGVLFLLRNIGLFSFDFNRIWPIFLIGLGGWLFACTMHVRSMQVAGRNGTCGAGNDRDAFAPGRCKPVRLASHVADSDPGDRNCEAAAE